MGIRPGRGGRDSRRLRPRLRGAAEALRRHTPQGLILHAVGARGNGMRVIDVWESQDAYQRFREEQLVPAMEAAMPGAMAQGPPPGMEPLELHNLIRP